jgi:hypothetical protein
MRRLDGGAGRRRAWRCASLLRRPKRETAAAGAAPAGVVRSHAPGRLRDPPWGYYGPCARCSLKAPVHRGEKRGPELRHRPRRCREPQQGAERRAGPRHGPAIFGDPKIGPSARWAIGCGVSAPAPVGALLPSRFSGSGRGQGASGALAQTGQRSVGCLTIESAGCGSASLREKRSNPELQARLDCFVAALLANDEGYACVSAKSTSSPV